MKKGTPADAELSAYLAPNEIMIGCRPPYCTLSPQAWRLVTYSILRKEVLGVRPDNVREVVGQWVEQLVRRELGSALMAIEARGKRTLHLEVSTEAAELIRDALARPRGPKRAQ